MSNIKVNFTTAEVEDSLGNRLTKLAERIPGHLAFKCQGSELDFKELNARANQLAHDLLEREPASKTVAILVNTPDRQAIAQLGILKAGLVCVPMDPGFPSVRKSRILDDSKAALLLTDSDLESQAESLVNEGVRLVNLDFLRGQGSRSTPDVQVKPTDLSYILYTSGSTGEPKGVMQNHRNLLHVAMLYHVDLGVRAGGRVTSPTALTYTGTIWAFLSALMNGAAFVCTDFDSPDGFYAQLKREGITTAQLITTLLRQFMHGLDEQVKLPDLRKVYTGGEALHWADVETFAQRFPDHCGLLYNFGSTEAGIISHHAIDLTDRHSNRADQAHQATPLPVGCPVINTKVVIKQVRNDEMNAVRVGEIVVQSDYLALGYWDDAELTATCFEFEEGRSVRFHSRDLGYLSDKGDLLLQGRKDDQVKVLGYRINLEEIDAALRSVEGIVGVATAVQPDAEHKNQIVAFLQVGKGRSLSVNSLRQLLGEKVPKYMIPSRFIFVERIPVARNGKLDRSALLGLAAKPSEKNDHYVEPVTPQERFVCHLFQEILQMEQVGLKDNFINLGGDSITAFRFLGKLKSLLDVKLNPRVLFTESTMEGIARHLQDVPVDRFPNK